jgi:hypothetical protein
MVCSQEPNMNEIDEMHVLPIEQQGELFRVVRDDTVLFEGVREACEAFRIYMRKRTRRETSPQKFSPRAA